MRPLLLSTLVLVAGLLLVGVASCDPPPHTTPDPEGSPDAGGANLDTDSPLGDADSEDTTTTQTPAPTLEPEPCAAPCPQDWLCAWGLCVPEPPEEAAALALQDQGFLHEVPGPPQIDCHTHPSKLEPGSSTRLRLQGRLVKLENGGLPTQSLCVTAWNAEAFVTRQASVCAPIEDTTRRLRCASLDPCRCAQLHPPDSEGLSACLTELGFCAPIEDPDARERCRQVSTAANPDTGSESIYGSTSSFPSEHPSYGAFTLDALPTHTALVLKVSGDPALWVDTYTFHLVLLPPEDASDALTLDLRVTKRQLVDALDRSLEPETLHPERGVVWGQVRDCGLPDRQIQTPRGSGDASPPLPISSATVGIDPPGAPITYFNGDPIHTFPFPGTYTKRLGYYALFNVPPGPGQVGAALRLEPQLPPQPLAPLSFFLPPDSAAQVSWGQAFWPEP